MFHYSFFSTLLFLNIQWVSLSLSLSQRKPGEDDLLPAARQERALPQLWGRGLATAQWRRWVTRGQEGTSQGRELLFSDSSCEAIVLQSVRLVPYTGTHDLRQWIWDYLRLYGTFTSDSHQPLIGHSSLAIWREAIWMKDRLRSVAKSTLVGLDFN